MKKNILVAGGLGFIGKNFCKTVAKDPDVDITIIDNLSSSSIGGLEEFIKFNNIHFIQESITITNFQMWLSVMCRNIKFNEIWNFACIASPKGYREHPMQTIEACTRGIINLCEVALQHHATLFHTSTSEVYGDTDEEMVESNVGKVNCFGPRSCYDEGKRIAETIIYEYIVGHNLDARIYRLFNTFGPGMMIDDGRVVSNFIVKAIFGLPLEIYGNPNKTRTFCYVDETIEKMLLASRNIEYRHPMNIGSDVNTLSLYELACKVLVITNSDSDIIYGQEPTDDPKQRIPNIEYLKNGLAAVGEYPTCIDIDYGIRQTVEYFCRILEGFTADDIKNRYDFSTYKTKEFL